MRSEPPLLGKIVEVSQALHRGGVAHALGGALSLAWCTGQARGTIDIDVNVFVAPAEARRVFASLPSDVAWSDAAIAEAERDGQIRLWWGRTPVDVFFDTTDFHRSLLGRVRHHELAGISMPFLACEDLAVFKAFFDRTKDWADLEAMFAAGSIDAERVGAVVAEYLGPDDARLARLRRAAEGSPTG